MTGGCSSAGPRGRVASTPVWVGAALLCLAAGCKPGGESARWLTNGFIDPTQVGQFLEPRRNEIRASLSILEEPMGIEGAEEPRPEDVVAAYDDHLIMPGDVINISIFELLVPGEATAQQILVGRSGFESLPILGRVRMAGRSTSQLEMELKDLLRSSDILPNPEVQVALVASRSSRFSIIGNVARAGTYEVPHPDYRLLTALADAGGIPPSVQRVYVFRKEYSDATGQGLEAAPTNLPAAERSDEPVPTPVFFTMSEVASGPSSGPTSSTTSGPQTTVGSQPSSNEAPIDELQILEGGPTEEQQNISWDPQSGTWVIKPASQESVPSAPSEEPATSTPLAAPDEAARPPELAPPNRIIEIPVKELMAGDPRFDVVVKPMDLINVQPGNVGEYYMMGNVNRPGAYDTTGRRLTVKEAIAAAGGLGPLAWPSRADLIRRVTTDEEQIIQLDLDAIFAGNAPDFYVKPNDIVNVGTTPAATFLAVLRNAFRFSYGFGFVYDRNFADSDTFAAKEQVKQRRNQEAQLRGVPIQ